LKYFWNPTISPQKVSTLYHAALIAPNKSYIEQMVELGYNDCLNYFSLDKKI
jgi:hypothetical protein